MRNPEQHQQYKERPDRETLIEEALELSIRLITLINEVQSKKLEFLDPNLSPLILQESLSHFKKFMESINNKIYELNKEINLLIYRIRKFFPRDQKLEKLVFEL